MGSPILGLDNFTGCLEKCVSVKVSFRHRRRRWQRCATPDFRQKRNLRRGLSGCGAKVLNKSLPVQGGWFLLEILGWILNKGWFLHLRNMQKKFCIFFLNFVNIFIFFLNCVKKWIRSIMVYHLAVFNSFK